MMKKLLFAAIMFLLTPVIAGAVVFETYQGKVVGVVDGDTIKVLRRGKETSIRLNGVDAPESRQAFGKRAKEYVSAACFGKLVVIEETDLDKYGRTVAEVTLPDETSLNRAIVRDGFAWWFRKYSTDETLKRLEAEARAARRGLWADNAPISPWDWRQAQAASAAATTDSRLPIASVPAPLSYQPAAAVPALVSAPVSAPVPAAAAAPDRTVYITPTGSKYHSEFCRTLRGNKTPILLSRARERYEPCGVCGGR